MMDQRLQIQLDVAVVGAGDANSITLSIKDGAENVTDAWWWFYPITSDNYNNSGES